MDNQNRKLELLGNAPIPKALLAMGIPTMIGMLINALYNLVDAYFVGGLGESQMAAISVVYPLGQVVVGLGLLFGNGAASYISRLLGQRNKDQANKVASTALYSSLVVGAIMIVLSILFLKPIVFQLLTSISISLINNAAGNYGDSAIAGMGVVTRLISMGSLTVFGFIKGFQPIAGYSYGAKKFDRLRTAIKISILWSTIFCVIVGLLFSLFSTTIVSQFTIGNTEMIHIGASSLRINGITFMLFGYYTVYSSLFLALGKGKEGFILGACRQGICFIPVILIFPFIWGLNGILYAQPIADVLSALITVFMAIPLHKSLTIAEQKMKTTSIPCDRQ